MSEWSEREQRETIALGPDISPVMRRQYEQAGYQIVSVGLDDYPNGDKPLAELWETTCKPIIEHFDENNVSQFFDRIGVDRERVYEMMDTMREIVNGSTLLLDTNEG